MLKQYMAMLMSQPGVMDHGRVSSHLVAREKWRSTFHLYVTDTDAEIDCISIKESLATGCIPLLSKFGVFPEREGFHFEVLSVFDYEVSFLGSEIPNYATNMLVCFAGRQKA